VQSITISKDFGIDIEKLLVPESKLSNASNLFLMLKNWNISSHLRPHLACTSNQSPGKKSLIEKPLSLKKKSKATSLMKNLFFGMPNAPFEIQPTSPLWLLLQ
jgi:hypothetical protein